MKMAASKVLVDARHHRQLARPRADDLTSGGNCSMSRFSPLPWESATTISVAPAALARRDGRQRLPGHELAEAAILEPGGPELVAGDRRRPRLPCRPRCGPSACGACVSAGTAMAVMQHAPSSRDSSMRRPFDRKLRGRTSVWPRVDDGCSLRKPACIGGAGAGRGARRRHTNSGLI